MNKNFGICNLSVVPIRAEASDKSEILSQLLFGDGFQILESTEKWTKILTVSDEYTGWIDHKQYQPLSQDELFHISASSVTLGIAPYHVIEKKRTGEKLYLLAGSSIPKPENQHFQILDEQYKVISPEISTYHFESDLELLSTFFLHAPYLWGGRTLFGIDCSGFTQIVFKMLGLKIKRDAWQQAEQGEIVSFLQEARPGDLAFFDNDEGKITHVGIMLDDHKIIHASGRVKIDPIDDQGIYSLDLKKHTHKLRIIKRYNF